MSITVVTDAMSRVKISANEGDVLILRVLDDGLFEDRFFVHRAKTSHWERVFPRHQIDVEQLCQGTVPAELMA